MLSFLGLKKGPASHTGITCDGCRASPLPGVRFKCLKCADTDLCAKCVGSYTSAAHASSHCCIAIPVPAPSVLTSSSHDAGAPGCSICGDAAFAGPSFTCTVCPTTTVWCGQCEAQLRHDPAHSRLKKFAPSSAHHGVREGRVRDDDLEVYTDMLHSTSGRDGPDFELRADDSDDDSTAHVASSMPPPVGPQAKMRAGYRPPAGGSGRANQPMGMSHATAGRCGFELTPR